MGLPLPSLWVLFLLCRLLFLPVSALNEEGIALLSFKRSIKDDPESSLADWNPSHQNPCSWNGIICKQGTVVSITIPKKQLLGTLPPALGSLPSIRHINLRSNRLVGNLPSELFSARGLQSLVLYGNSLSGSLPKEISNLSSLQNLDLSQNSFSGSMPSSLINCKRLKSLDLSHNNFSGSLPPSFGSSMGSLERLDLSYNLFNGSIPGDIGNLSNLEGTVDFSHNLFSGSLPASLGDLPEKVYIDLTYNNLSGPIPQRGALQNRGPTAFIGNPGLCGPPLKNPCSANAPASGPFLPSSYPPSGSEANHTTSMNRRLSRNMVAAIVVSDVIGIGLIALMFFYCYWRATSSSIGTEERAGNSNKGKSKSRKECMCFRKEESETISENVQQFDLVPLDRKVGFDLDELLKSSAFVLGKSGMGIMYKVVLEDGITMAVRRLGEGGSQRFKEFQTEVEAIGKVRHPNIVSLIAYYWSIDEKLLIYDYIPNGNLSEAIHGSPGSVAFPPLSWNLRLKIMQGIARGLAFLHEFSPKKYVHGDLKTSNILLGLNMEPYISDFGLGRLANIAGVSASLQSSNRIDSEKPKNQHFDLAISPLISSASCYQAPDALKALKPSQKWDIYSYGVILLELISGRSPVVLLETKDMDLVGWVQWCIEEKKSASDLLDPFLAREVEREDEIFAVLKIALACVHVNPDKRPSVRHIVNALERLIIKS